MKILFCTKNDLFGAFILNWIMPRLKGHEVRVWLSDKTRPAENMVAPLAEEKFLERDLPLQTIFPLLDATQLSGEWLTFKALELKYEYEATILNSFKDPQPTQALRQWGPDVIVSARFSLIFKSEHLQIPRWGIFNIHPGALPGYGGLYAPMRALLNGESRLGCTLHKVDEGIDTGPIYSVSYRLAEPQRSVFSHISDLYQLGLQSLIELLAQLEAGQSLTLNRQDPQLNRYYRLPEPSDFQLLAERGLCMASYPDFIRFLNRFVPKNLVDTVVSLPKAKNT